MNPEVYTQDMRANHELCPYCGVWHTSMSCAPQFATQSMRIVDIESELTALRARIAALEAALTNATEKWVFVDDDGHFECYFCDAEAVPFRSIDEPDNDENNGWNCDHEADCPTQW